MVKERGLDSQAEAEDLLKKIETIELCVGALDLKGYDPSFFTKRLQEQVMSRQGTYFNRNCLDRVEEKGEHCSIFFLQNTSFHYFSVHFILELKNLIDIFFCL